MSDRRRLEELSADKLRALVGRIREKKKGDDPADAEIPREGLERAPLSFAQERLWFLDQLTPGLAAYNMPIAVELAGKLEPAALAGVLRALFERHEVLRTRFGQEGGRPVQVIVPAAEVVLPFAVVDLRSLPAGDEEAARRMEADSARPFDLHRGPLLRVHLLRLGDARHLLLANMHHIVSDGWSLGVLISELGALWRGESLPPLPIQYADYALWQRRWLTGKVLERQLEYWRKQLAGLPVLELLPDRRRPVEQSYRGAAINVDLPAELARALARLARESRGVTLFMVLLAGFAALLSRYAGQEDVAVGTMVANRGRREVEGLIGMFVNTLVLRADLSGGVSFAGLVARLREVMLGAHEHQDLPFEKLVEDLRPERDTSHAPLVQVTFAQSTPMASLELPGLASALVPLESQSAKFDLTLALGEADGGLAGGFEYNADLFDRATIERMAGHLERLLEGAVAAPEVPLSQLALLAAAERRQLVADWSRTGTAEGLSPVPARFAAQAAEGPDRPAVLAGDAVVTYGELAGRVHRLAGALRAVGVGPEERVGLCLERGAGMVEAVLAVMAAGGAYVPLDPAFPDERLTMMLEDAAPRVVLADPRHRERLHTPAVLVSPEDLLGLRVGAGLGVEGAGRPARGAVDPSMCADPRPGRSPSLPEPPDLPLREAGQLSHPAVAPETAAYVLFTSGSTGRPKGVAVEHRSLAAFLLAMEELELLAAGRTLLAVTTLGFDIAGLELYLPLVSGGTVAVATREQAADGRELARLIAEHRIGTLQATPATWPLLLAADFQAEDGFQALSGGEALSTDLASRLLAAGARLTNLYGPTETTVWSAALAVGEPHLESATVALGRPIARTGIYILDETFAPTPLGVPGELAIGGAGVARGYLGLAERTAERFVPDPFGAPGGRLYRTGDRARWKSPRAGEEQGELEFLGRLDHQVKLRGFRIELGEIEAALAALPGVSEAVVLLRHDPPGEPRLAAYWSPAGEEVPETVELRRACQERLPAYMVPTAFVRLEHLPRLPNGKLDRRSLPVPAALEGAAVFAAPENSLEAAVAEIWAEVLGLGAEAKVGMGDDFFADLGGHSLLATQMIALLRQRLGVELPLRSLFAAPTARGWAALVAQAVAAEGVPLTRRTDNSGPLPLSYAQERLWFLEQLTPELSAYNLPLAVGLSGQLDAAALSGAIATVLERHEALRTRFLARQGQPAQEVLPLEAATTFVLPRIDLAALPAAVSRAEAARLTGAEAARPFDLAQGPLLRALLLDLGSDQYRLLLTVHHIASDAWSMGVLMGELSALYGGETLPELPVQYGDYALWQRQQLSAEAIAQELAWWRQELAGLPTLTLPTDHPRPRLQSYRGGDVFLTLPAELGAALRQQCRRAGATLFMALLAGFSALLARFSGQDDFAIGTVVANRPRRELEGLIGFFVNTLVLRAGPTGRPSFARHLETAREVALSAFAHQDLPFARLVEELHPVRDTSQTPLVQVLLVLQNAPRPPVEVRGLAMSAEPEERGVALFDLTLQMVEEEGRIGCRFEYNADLFDRATIHRLAERWQRLLTYASAEPDRPLATLPWLTAVERQQTLHEWNAGPAAPQPVIRVHQPFEQHAARSPETVAVVDGSRRLTYGELDRQANRLAQTLLARGVGPEARVGLCLPRTAEMVIGMLAILKAGGAYVPLDPEYPAERLALLRADSGLDLVISEPEIASRLGIAEGAVVSVPASEAWRGEAPASEDGAQLSERQRVRLSPPSGDEHRPEPSAPSSATGLAYLIYTSGSTGTPKGVAISHANTLSLLQACAKIYPPEWLTGVFAGTSIAFDLSVFEILGTLAWGGTLVLARNLFDEAAWDGDWPITLINTVPSALDRLVEARALPPTVQTVNLAGEALPGALARKLYQRGIARVINLYAPSETTTYSTYALAEAGDDAPPIGRPLAGSQAYVLDGELEPVPPGVEGQIFLGGLGVTRGYLGRPELTAERYVPDPFADGEVGARLYRTGDRGRHRPDGNLEYLGRVDQQIKLRGFRIEPGEIEAVLAAVPGVREAMVVLREDAPGDRRLVAYVTLEETAAPPPAQLRQRCQEIFPAHMVPAAFVVLEAFPRLPNGKLDRRTLAEKGPAPAFSGTAEGFVPPRTPAEELVAAAWSEVLGLPAGGVGIHDDFFDLGGHSLLATQVASRLRDAFGVEIPLRLVFETPTVAALALAAEAAGRGDRGLAAPPLRPIPRTGDLPLSFAQEWMWYIDQLDPTGQAFGSPIHVRLGGELDVAAFSGALSEVVRRHEVLRTVFPQVGGRPVQRILPAAPLPLPLADLEALPEERRDEAAAALASAQFRLPMDLALGPLVRALLVRRGPALHTLVMTIHHIHFDGWSARVLLAEMAALYRSFAAGEPSPLPPLPLQVADFAVWQREWLQGPPYEALLAYWRGRLGSDTPVLELPGARQAELTSLRSARATFSIAPEIAAAARALSRRSHATLFSVLLAAWGALLARTAHASRIPVGTPIANRNRGEIEGLVGYFVNTLVMSLDLAGDPTFAELVLRVREVALGAYAHQDMPFTRLIEELRPGRAAARTPLFQVLFLLQNVPMQAIELPGLTLAGEGSDVTMATFDLSLVLTEIEAGGGLDGALWYNRDLFEPAAIADLIERYRVLLEGAVTTPELALAELPLLTGEERRQLLLASSADPAGAEASEVDLYSLFAARAAQDPRAVAFVTEDEEITYGELAARAEAAVRELEAAGIAAAASAPWSPPWTVESLARHLATARSGGAAILAAVTATAERLRLDDRDVWALCQPEAAEVWGALLSGGALAPLPDDGDPGGLAAAIADTRATVLAAPPAVLDRLASLPEARPWRSLRWVIVRAEDPDPAILARWTARYGDRKPRLARRVGGAAEPL